ncbi:hypothetical protein ABGI61_15800 [Rheinheimera sp. FR7-31]|uniref:hypothetical protein n=1 Tax=Rheinheimera fenheensis TaxID=3152295 RepID=UPI00325CC261
MPTEQANRIKAASIISRYWTAYGGVVGLLSSLYFWGALILSGCLHQIWIVPGWWDTVLSVIPNLLGFSLGGFALWIAIGDDKFREFIAVKSPNETVSIYEGINANFVHFIVLQTLALVCALWAKGMNFALPEEYWIIVHFREQYFVIVKVFTFLGFAVFVYALLTALSATLGLYRVTRMYEAYLAVKVQREVKKVSAIQRKSLRLQRMNKTSRHSKLKYK